VAAAQRVRASAVPRERNASMCRSLREALDSLVLDEEGATLVEYMLLVVLIGVAAIVGMTFLGKTANNRLNNVTDAIK
jgi:Flp pilus assembly pilin Flp